MSPFSTASTSRTSPPFWPSRSRSQRGKSRLPPGAVSRQISSPTAWTASPEAWIALGALTTLKIDNIVFISILSNKLPTDQQPLAHQVGPRLAFAGRIPLLFSISRGMFLTAPLFSVFAYAFSGRDLTLRVGGCFLIGKATTEIHVLSEREGAHRTDMLPWH
ncbi:TerC family protein [Salinibacter altiplanensis]|uniref:TerC family protein n=1 Tax=Salinibacter altiplanensis TaxID=1803181 RepID=UPI001E4EE4A9